jgi:hypothetical protein
MMRLHGKQGPSGVGSQDRRFAASIVRMVTFVLLLVGFCGQSDDLRLPGRWGWIYIGVVTIVATAALVWLISADGKRKRSNESGSKTNNAARIGAYKRQ